MEGGRGCKLWSQEHKSFLLQITSWPPVLTSPSPPPHPALLAVTQIFHYQQNQQMSVELICDPVMDGEKPPFATEWPPSPLKKHGHNSAYCCQVGRPIKEGGRVQLKTGLKLWENILQTVRRIDFQIIEVKGIAVIFIYSKSSSLNFQLLVEVVIKNGYGDICMTSTYQFVFSVYLFFMIPYSCQSIWSWEQGYPVWAWQSSICGAVSGKKEQFLFTWLLELVLITEG